MPPKGSTRYNVPRGRNTAAKASARSKAADRAKAVGSGKRKLPDGVPVSFSPFDSPSAVASRSKSKSSPKRARTSLRSAAEQVFFVDGERMARKRLRTKTPPSAIIHYRHPPMAPTLRPTSGRYDTLQIGRHAAPMVVRRAYRLRALSTHPDKPGGTKDAFERVLEAYGVLIDDSARQDYDAELASGGGRDGLYWSDNQPGMRASVLQQPMFVNGMEDPDGIQIATKMSIQTWLRTFRGHEEMSLSGLSLLQLTILHETFCHQQQVGIPVGAMAHLIPTAAKAKKRHRVSHVQFMEGLGYRVEMTQNRLGVVTQPTSSLERAIEWSEALLNMRASAHKRIRKAIGSDVFVKSQQTEDPLIESEVLQALQDQPTMRMSFRVGMSRSQHVKCNTPQTRDLELAISWWREGTFTMANLKKGKKVQAKSQVDAIKMKQVQHERAFSVFEEVRRNLTSRAVNSMRREKELANHERDKTHASLDQKLRERREQTLANHKDRERQQLDDNAKANGTGRLATTPKSSAVGKARGTGSPIAAVGSSFSRQVWRPLLTPTPSSASSASAHSADRPALFMWPSSSMPARPGLQDRSAAAAQSQRPSALKTPAAKAKATTAKAAPKATGGSRTGTPPLSARAPPARAPPARLPPPALMDNVTEVLVLPDLSLKTQDVGRLLGCLSLDDLSTLQAASKGMRMNREMELKNRLRVFYYNGESHQKPSQYSRSGRVVRPVNPIPQIANRLCNFLRHFARYIKELHLETAPCELLENKVLLEALSSVSVSLAVFPADGWSSNVARKRVVQALRAGTVHKFLDSQGYYALEVSCRKTR